MLKKGVMFALLPVLFSCGSKSHQSKEFEPHEQVKRDLQVQRENLAQADKSADAVGKARAQMEINYLNDMLEANGDPGREEKVKRSYRIMRQELQRQIVAYESQQQVGADAPKGVVTFSGGGLTGPAFTSVYHKLSLEAVRKVFRDFGELYVNETVDGSGKPVFERLQVARPWSGYWYPFTDHSMYEGEQAPLKKFDEWLKKLGHDSDAAGFEQRRYKGFRPDSWEGFCDGWAIAAIMEPEPRKPLVLEGVNFSILDQKSLMTFAYLSFPAEVYGFRYMGNAHTDGSYQSLHPEAFHQVITSVLGKERQAVVIDDTAGVQVWNKPLFSYRWQISKDPERDYAFNVIAYPWLVRERWQQTDTPTSFDDVLAPVYKYRLYVDKEDERDGQFRVVAGEWLEESWENHPGSVKHMRADGKMASHNEFFNKYIDLYRQNFLKK